MLNPIPRLSMIHLVRLPSILPCSDQDGTFSGSYRDEAGFVSGVWRSCRSWRQASSASSAAPATAAQRSPLAASLTHSSRHERVATTAAGKAQIEAVVTSRATLPG